MGGGKGSGDARYADKDEALVQAEDNMAQVCGPKPFSESTEKPWGRSLSFQWDGRNTLTWLFSLTETVKPGQNEDSEK